MERIAIIGAGISGMSAAHHLKETYDIRLFEQENSPGGLIRCRKINDCLFHTCGGHVFNSKREDVLSWFWSIFNQNKDFVKADRNSVVFMENGSKIPYPIENHVYMIDEVIQNKIIEDIVQIAQRRNHVDENFEDFLIHHFGHTLYHLYFKPYNEKVWKRQLTNVPLSWLEGKLPMPTVQEIIFNNINHVKEKTFVHSQFWYEKTGGSQFLANHLSEGLNICYNTMVNSFKYNKDKHTWNLCGQEFEKVIFCGNIKDLVKNIHGIDLNPYYAPIEALEYHGTTAVFCEIDRNPYSWIYLPSEKYKCHRIICTGNFSPSNNSVGKMTGTVEFTDKVDYPEIIKNLNLIPLNPRYMDHCYNEFTYPIQDQYTRKMIAQLKAKLAPYGLFFTGRFADWEYYNMDAAMGAAIDLSKTIKSKAYE